MLTTFVWLRPSWVSACNAGDGASPTEVFLFGAPIHQRCIFLFLIRGARRSCTCTVTWGIGALPTAKLACRHRPYPYRLRLGSFCDRYPSQKARWQWCEAPHQGDFFVAGFAAGSDWIAMPAQDAAPE